MKPPVSGLALLYGFALASCYSYVPVAPLTPRRGDVVRVELTRPGGDFTLQNVTVRGILIAEGRVLLTDGDSVVLAASRLWSESDSYEGWNIGIPVRQQQIVTIRRKHLSGAKTAVVLGASGAAIAAIIAGVGPLSGSGGGGVPPPPQP